MKDGEASEDETFDSRPGSGSREGETVSAREERDHFDELRRTTREDLGKRFKSGVGMLERVVREALMPLDRTLVS